VPCLQHLDTEEQVSSSSRPCSVAEDNVPFSAIHVTVFGRGSVRRTSTHVTNGGKDSSQSYGTH
jgi:hypothetical protein